jgi:hypothetical protein
MTTHDQRDTTRTPVLPSQRAPEDRAPEDAAAQGVTPQRGVLPRPARPRSEFWDVETASWRTRGPIPAQRMRV